MGKTRGLITGENGFTGMNLAAFEKNGWLGIREGDYAHSGMGAAILYGKLRGLSDDFSKRAVSDETWLSV